MPGGFPIANEVYNGTSVTQIASSPYGIQVNANAAANTLGAYTVVTASTTSDCGLIRVVLNGFVNVGPTVAMDLAVGSTGNEKVFANQLVVSGKTSAGGYLATYDLPIAIPKGTQISARCQSSGTSDGAAVALQLFDGSFTSGEGYAGVDSIGFVAASTHGTQIDPGGTANTKGAYAVLTASTPRDYAGLMFGYDALNQTSGSGTTQFGYSLDVAIGATGSEKIIIPDVTIQKFFYAASPIACQPSDSLPIFVPIPSGTQIQVRAACGNATSPNRLIGVTAYGIYL